MPNKRHNGKYKKAISSQHWKDLRNTKYQEQSGRCQGCGKPFIISRMELHHLHYKTLGEERSQDVELTCKPCHLIADRKRIIKKSIVTFCNRYYKNHGTICPNHVLARFISTKLIPGLPTPQTRNLIQEHAPNRN